MSWKSSTDFSPEIMLVKIPQPILISKCLVRRWEPPALLPGPHQDGKSAKRNFTKTLGKQPLLCNKPLEVYEFLTSYSATSSPYRPLLFSMLMHRIIESYNSSSWKAHTRIRVQLLVPRRTVQNSNPTSESVIQMLPELQQFGTVTSVLWDGSEGFLPLECHHHLLIWHSPYCTDGVTNSWVFIFQGRVNG